MTVYMWYEDGRPHRFDTDAAILLYRMAGAEEVYLSGDRLVRVVFGGDYPTVAETTPASVVVDMVTDRYGVTDSGWEWFDKQDVHFTVL